MSAMFSNLELLEHSSSVLSFLLLNSLYAAMLAGLVLFIKLIYPRLPKSLEYGMWCLVLIRLVLPCELSFDYAVSGVIHNWFISSANEAGISLTVLSSNQWLYILFLFWSIVTGLVFIRYLFLRIKLLKMINLASPIVEYPIVALANRWRLNFWIKRPVHVIAEDKYLSPFTFFFKSPIIFIPRKILETKDDVLIESIIAHEMAHVKRKDSLWLILQNLIQIAYFFNPLVWLIVRRLSALREDLCDEMVLSTKQIEPKEYGSSLLQVLRFNISGEFATALSSAFLGYKSQIKQRIKSIGNFSKPLRYSRLHSLVVVFLAVLFLPFFNSPPVANLPTTIVLKEDPNSPFPAEVQGQVKLPKVDREKE